MEANDKAHDAIARTMLAVTMSFFLFQEDSMTWNPIVIRPTDEYKDAELSVTMKDGRGSYRRTNLISPNPEPKLMYEWRRLSLPDKGLAVFARER